MADELFIPMKTALLNIFKNGGTLVGTNVRTGKTIPLDNPFSDYAAPETENNLGIFQMKRLQYENTGSRGQRAQYKRITDWQFDGYLVQDDVGADAAGIDIETHQDNQLDQLCSEIMDLVTFNTILDLSGEKVEIYPEDIVKNEITNQSGIVLGSVSLRIRAEYQQDRRFEPVSDLDNSYNTVQNGAGGSINKIIQLEV